MTDTTRVLLLGATGAVGGGCLDVLARCPDVSLLLAGRDEARLRDLAGAHKARIATTTLDAADAQAVSAAAAGCDVVISCAGPSQQFSARVAEAAVGAGVPYVDPGGDHALLDRLAADGPAVPVVLQAGVQPGLSGLMLRALAQAHDDEIDAITAWCGGLQRLTAASVLEYVASLRDGHSHAGAALRDGAIRRVGHHECEPPPGQHFPASAVARAHLDAETVAVAAHLGVGNVLWLNVFDGAHTTRTMQLVAAAERSDAHTDLDSVLAAAKLDLFGRRPYFAIVATARGAGSASPSTLAFSCPDSYRVTGALAAFAAQRVAGMTAGVHPFWTIGEPQQVLDFVAEAVPGVELSLAHDSVIEEGAL